MGFRRAGAMERDAMLKSTLAAGVMLAMVAGTAQAQVSPEVAALLTRDVPRAADHPLTGRYQGSALLAQTVKAFDEIRLPSGPAEGKSYDNNKKFSATVTAQGRITRSIYVAPQGRSALEVMSNFDEAVRAKGLELVFRCSREACGDSFVALKYRWNLPETKVLGENYEHIRKLMVDAVFDQLVDVRYSLFKKSGPEGETYVAVYGGLHRGGQFGNNSAALQDRVGVLVEIAEPRAMESRMVVVSAAEIGGKVMAEGRAVFYGIQFDFDKADIKPESEPQLAEMAKFLGANPATRVYIIGHTDNKGTLDYNVGLSNRRAEAVVKTLAAKYRIDAKRMTPRGLGPLAPVASNRNEEGQAKNRRVEMVEQ
jgi:outer membrane protein OmpA-like peptidoglycan-associated protein